MIKTIYLNLEDDVAKIVAQLQRHSAQELVLVFPKQSFMFSDSINMRLLKKQVDLLRKKVYVLTMDEKGKMYAQEAGFELKFLPKSSRTSSVSDIRRASGNRAHFSVAAPVEPIEEDFIEEEPEPIVPPRKVLRKKPAVSTSNIHVPVPAQRVRATDNVYVPPSKENLKVRPKKTYRKYTIGFIAISMIVVLVLVLVVLPSATVNVYAKSQIVSRDIDIIADVNANNIDSAKLTIPATAVNETQNISSDFQTLGKREVGSKSQGRIAIYNLTGSPITLRAGTTTLTAGSKTYVFNADQNLIRSVSGPNDTNPPVADIVAVDGGEGSNLPAGTRLEITNQAFGSQPERLYAKTVSQVIGGSSRFISVVTSDDIKTAQEQLTQKVVDTVNQELKNDSRMIVNGSYTVSVSSFGTDKPEGTESPTFSASAQVSITGLAINENELKQMVRQRLMLSLGDTKTLQDPSNDKVVYRTKNIDGTNGIMQLSLNYESVAIPNIDTNNLKNQLAGKSKAEAAELILSNPDIDKTEITVQPAWQSSIPRFTSKIKLELK